MIATMLALTLVAHPRPFPFTYVYPSMPAGALELEQYVDMIPLLRERENVDGTLEGIMTMRFALQTEIELGITDRIELGFYLVANQNAQTQVLQFDGLKQRVKVRLFEQGELPVDIALYGEIAELVDEFEIEEKVILSTRTGPLIIAANLWFEQEYVYGDRWKVLFNPTAGVSLELSPHVNIGVEGWMRGSFTTGGEPTHGFVGPILMAQLGEYWATLGGYLRLDDFGTPLVVGQQFGALYFRAIVGIGLH